VIVKRIEVDEKIINYVVDKIFVYEDKLILKGNAKMIFPKNELIKANKLLICLE
jgi:uncharacterized linocin/CFP29 family protein